MRIAYVANIRLPTEKAHGVQIVKTVSAIKTLGHEIDLYITNRSIKSNDEIFKYYDVENNFPIFHVPVPDIVALGYIPFIIESIMFSVRTFMILNKKKYEVIYCRDEIVAMILSIIGLPVFWEAHRGHYSWVVRALIRRVRGVIAISHGIKKYYIERGVSKNKIEVIPDAAEIADFTIVNNIEIKKTIPTIIYTGSLGREKGIETLLESLKHIKTPLRCLVVGGSDEQVNILKQKYGSIANLQFVGHVPHTAVAGYLSTANIAIIPSSAKDIRSREFTSPMKLFEYIAAKVPIVASDVPSNREILDENSAVFFRPDDPLSLAQAIDQLMKDKEHMANLSANEGILAQKYTFSARADKILSVIQS